MAVQGGLELLVLLGGSILAGYAGQAIFRRFRVSDILVLLICGFVAGPVLGLLDPAILKPAIPFLGPLGLALILFEGGLELRWADVQRHGARSLAFSLLTWTISTAVLTILAHHIFALPWMLALLFSVAVAATGIVAVIPALAQLKAPNDARVLLTVETSLGDLLSAVAVTALASILLFGTSWAGAGAALGAEFLVGGAVGVIAGIGWGRVLHILDTRRHVYALTMGAVVLVYAATELLHGSGFLAAVVFGAFLGNVPELLRTGALTKLAPFEGRLREHGSEIVFVLRSVYFVYLGASMRLDVLSPPFLLAGLVIAVALTLARVVAVVATYRGEPRTRILLVGMMPRAMAAAVLASVPAAMGVPGADAFMTYAFLVIVACDIATTIGLYVYERGRGTVPGPAPLHS